MSARSRLAAIAAPGPCDIEGGCRFAKSRGDPFEPKACVAYANFLMSGAAITRQPHQLPTVELMSVAESFDRTATEAIEREQFRRWAALKARDSRRLAAKAPK